MVRPDGVERVTQICFRSATDVGGRVRLIGTVQDITDMERARRELERVSRYNGALLNSAGDGICGLSIEGSVTFANPAALRATGHGIDGLRGCDLHATLQHSNPTGRRTQRTTARSRHRFAMGRCTAAIATSSGARTLRTPLASVRGALGLIESGVLRASPEKAQRMIEIAVHNTDRVVRLIDDILDIERIGSGTVRMNIEPCDAAQLIQQASDGLASMADAANVTLVTRTQPVRIVADADRILQTLTNLIGNAIQFSEAGMSVGIAVEARDGEARFDVSDEGRGIPTDKLETIFGRFEQVDASDSRDTGGTGLGLTICRAIVELHGGRIWAHSPPGAGATVSFTLPA